MAFLKDLALKVQSMCRGKKFIIILMMLIMPKTTVDAQIIFITAPI